MMNLTNKQYLSIVMAVLAFLSASSGQLSEFLGIETAKAIASGASFLNGILAAVLAAILGQGSILRDVQAMPGVEKITVNASANPTLANLAVDPNNPKIEPKIGHENAVEHLADKGA